MERRAFLGKALDSVIPRFSRDSETGLYLPEDRGISRRGFIARAGLAATAIAIGLNSSGCPATGPLGNYDFYMTVDDGPAENMGAMLDLFKITGNKVTFFVRGDHCNPETSEGAQGYQLIVQALNEGHIIGNHTYDHTLASELSEEDFKAEVERTQGIIQLAYDDAGMSDKNPMLFRYPGGDSKWQDTLTDLGYHSVFWNLSLGDWGLRGLPLDIALPKVEDKIDYCLKTLKKGYVLLLHDQDQQPYTSDYIMPAIFDANFKSRAITNFNQVN